MIFEEEQAARIAEDEWYSAELKRLAEENGRLRSANANLRAEVAAAVERGYDAGYGRGLAGEPKMEKVVP